MDAELKKLITVELTARVYENIAHALKMRADASKMLGAANAQLTTAAKMLECDLNGRHEFEALPGSDRLGDRFEERCVHCGWVHVV